jgi:hypothetical protein
MDELTLLARLREDIPAAADLSGPGGRLAAEITAASRMRAAAGGGRARERRRARGYAGRLVLASAVAVALAAAFIVVRSQPADLAPATAGAPRSPAAAVPGPAASAAQLVAYATRAAATAPAFNPQPHQWIYVKTLRASSSGGVGGMLFGPPNERVTTTTWTRVDNQREAQLKHGRLVYSRLTNLGGNFAGWPEVGLPVNYRYLDSLPSSPAKLEAVMAANLKRQDSAGSGSIGIFNAIQALMENVVLSPRLLASLYGVLARLHGVHFDPSAADIAGRHGLGFYTIQHGYDKDEIVINPATYAYLGREDVAVRAHTDIGGDGTFRIRKGHVLGWLAVLGSGIVQHAGQLP